MNTLELLTRVMEIKEEGRKAALATIIRKKGSIPREIGAKMIVFSDGEIEGTVGGGCGEGEIINKSFSVIKEGVPAQHQVDLTKGILYEDGGICGGIMDVFIEPI